MNLNQFDLNLLKTLDRLEQERSVQAAAVRLGVTASAVSHALSRLRRALDDPLFVRSRDGLAPTPRCLAVVGRMRPFLAAAESTLAGGADPGLDRFTPGRDRRTVTIVMPGALELTLLPELVESLRREAPGWTVTIRGFQRRSYEVDLLSADVDLVLSVGGHTPRSDALTARPLWTDEVVALQGPEGPLPKAEAVPLDQVLERDQIYPVPWPVSQNYLDIRLAREGKQRSLALTVPSYACVGDVLMRTELVATMPERTAHAILRAHPDLDLVRIAPRMLNSLSLEATVQLERSDWGRWLRETVVAAAARVAPGD